MYYYNVEIAGNRFIAKDLKSITHFIMLFASEHLEIYGKDYFYLSGLYERYYEWESLKLNNNSSCHNYEHLQLMSSIYAYATNCYMQIFWQKVEFWLPKKSGLNKPYKSKFAYYATYGLIKHKPKFLTKSLRLLYEFLVVKGKEDLLIKFARKYFQQKTRFIDINSIESLMICSHNKKSTSWLRTHKL